MLTTEALIAAIARLHYPSNEERREDRAQYVEAVKAYRAEERRLRDEWQEWLADEYAPEGLTERQTDMIFVQAWEQGHAEGYRAVEHEYESVADFLTKILKG